MARWQCRMFATLVGMLINCLCGRTVAGFAFSPSVQTKSLPRGTVLQATAEQTQESFQKLQSNVDQLKRVLAREYVSFFNPMEKEFYSADVTFEDPLTSLAGVDKYQNNVDMLSGRTLLGSLLFSDASINLHSVKGGEISVDETSGTMTVSDIVTRWTLRFCFKILPWKPTARFSGISVYKVRKGGSEGMQIIQQNDYWDSINLQPDGSYKAVDKSIGLSDFLNQLKPTDINAPSAAPELPFELLRRGNSYEVRRYPKFTAAKLEYERRDEGYSILGSFCKGLQPLAPAILTVDSNKNQKTMMWPLSFVQPGQDSELSPSINKEDRNVDVVVMPSSVVAVARFSDASVEPVVRRATNMLRDACQRDGLKLYEDEGEILRFCQYDAIFSMGKRRGEVWIPLDDDNPWSK